MERKCFAPYSERLAWHRERLMLSDHPTLEKIEQKGYRVLLRHSKREFRSHQGKKRRGTKIKEFTSKNESNTLDVHCATLGTFCIAAFFPSRLCILQ